MTRPDRPTRRWLDVRFAIAAALLALVSLVLGLFGWRYETFPGDRIVAAQARELGEAFAPVAWLFNEADVPLALAIVAALAVRLGRRGRVDGALAAALALALRPLLDLAKIAVGRARPEGDFLVLDVVHDSSFPSGHTMTAVVVFGSTFLLAPELVPGRWATAVRAAAVLGVALMAMSRMWAGVHWLSDTYGAIPWGMTVVAAAFALRPALRRLVNRLRGS